MSDHLDNVVPTISTPAKETLTTASTSAMTSAMTRHFTYSFTIESLLRELSAVGPVESFAMAATLSDEFLLRGMSVFHALSGFGHMFQSSAGSEQTFGLSAPVGRIRWFISHNWSVWRLEKFAVLALHFNWCPAVLITLLIMAVIFALTATGQLPLFAEVLAEDEGGTAPRGVCATATASVVFLLVLFSWHEVAGRAGLLRSKVFVDKACISQTNEHLKQKGITSLAAFLGNSDGMLVIYTDVYLRKMWTVYELACTLILFPHVRVIVVPTFLPKFLVVASLLAYVYYIVQFAWFWKGTHDALGSDSISNFAVGAPSIAREVCFCIFARWLARKKHRIKEAAASFRIRDAACFDEKDRPLVCGSVVHFMRTQGLVPEDATRKDTLKAFDELVRRKVPRFLLHSLGMRGLPYRIVVIIFLPLTAVLVDRAGAAVYHHEDPWIVLEIVMATLTEHLLYIPSMVKLASVSMHALLQLRGRTEVMFVCTASLLLSGLGWAAQVVLYHFSVWAYLSFFFVLTCVLYRPTCDTPQQRLARVSTSSTDA